MRGRFRIRISSIEPGEVSDKLLDYVTGHPRVCNHLHISLQSGSDRVLQRMGRHYKADEFFRLTDSIRKRDGLCGLGTDVITGFSGETETDFNETVRRIRESGLTYGHVFPFSPRKGTPAAAFSGTVTGAEKEKRSSTLKRVFSGLKNNFIQSMAGKTLTVLVEKNGTGYASNYVKMKCPHAGPAGTLEKWRVTGLENGVAACGKTAGGRRK